MGMLDGDAPGCGGLVGVAGTNDDQVGNGSQGRQLLNWLMRRAILAQADAIVGKDIDGFEPHQRCQANGGTHVIREDQEGCAKGDQTAVEGYAVENAAHRVLADTEVKIASSLLWSKIAQYLHISIGRRGEIG